MFDAALSGTSPGESCFFQFVALNVSAAKILSKCSENILSDSRESDGPFFLGRNTSSRTVLRFRCELRFSSDKTAVASTSASGEITP